jgi:hypothetical protein
MFKCMCQVYFSTDTSASALSSVRDIRRLLTNWFVQR